MLKVEDPTSLPSARRLLDTPTRTLGFFRARVVGGPHRNARCLFPAGTPMSSSHRRSMWYQRLVMTAVCVVSLLVVAGSAWIFQTHRIRPGAAKAPTTHDSPRAVEDKLATEPSP